MILLDTVVLSEPRKAQPNAVVLAFLKAQSPSAVFVSAISLGEIESGIERQRSINPDFANELTLWLATLEQQFASAILPVDSTVAKIWGRLCAQTGNKGTDNLIAATALRHNLTVATRNTKHFEPTGVRVINPFA
jgi:toxin FitB